MMKQLEISDIAKETLDILKCFDSKFISKIPVKFLDTLKELSKESNMKINIDKNKKLKDQDISEESKDLISLIYYDYIANEEEKNEIAQIWNENELLYQENLNKLYSRDNIFKKNRGNDFEQETSNLPSVIQKEKLIQKIINFLKKILKLKR